MKVGQLIQKTKVKTGIFRQTAKFGQRHCLYWNKKNKLTKQTVKFLMEPSHLDLHCLQMCVRVYLISFKWVSLGESICILYVYTLFIKQHIKKYNTFKV